MPKTENRSQRRKRKKGHRKKKEARPKRTATLPERCMKWAAALKEGALLIDAFGVLWRVLEPSVQPLCIRLGDKHAGEKTRLGWSVIAGLRRAYRMAPMERIALPAWRDCMHPNEFGVALP